MRYYLTLRGRLTTITVGEELSEYLIVRLGGFGAKIGTGKKKAQAWINDLATRERDNAPAKNVSQWVQAHIVNFIVDPALRDKRKVGLVAVEAESDRFRKLAAAKK